MICDWSPLHLFSCIKPKPIEVCWSLLINSQPLVVVEDLGGLGWSLCLGSRSGGRCRFDEGACLEFPVQKTVQVGVELLVTLDAVEVEAHKKMRCLK
jgi:hypothetical protein